MKMALKAKFTGNCITIRNKTSYALERFQEFKRTFANANRNICALRMRFVMIMLANSCLKRPEEGIKHDAMVPYKPQLN